MSHRQVIRDLVAEVRSLREQLSYMEYGADLQSSAMERQAANLKRQLRNAEYERQELESAASYRRYEVESATKELERAQRYGGEFSVSRAMRKLKSI